MTDKPKRRTGDKPKRPNWLARAKALFGKDWRGSKHSRQRRFASTSASTRRRANKERKRRRTQTWRLASKAIKGHRRSIK
jgi:hypothetical protein